MSPEHLRGEPTDARSDVYALGCVLHTALTGTPPFRRETVPAMITAHLHDPPPRPSDTPGVPAAFDAVLARALAKDPDHRYPSAGDLGRAALAAAAGEREHTARGSVARGVAAPEHAEPTRVAPAAGATAVASPAEMATALAEPPPRTRRQAPPRTADPRPSSVKVQRGRRRKLVLAATILVLALPAVLLARWVASAGGGPKTGPLSPSEVLVTAQAFADAYTQEDAAALRRVLTPGVRRVAAAGDTQRGRPAVVATYQKQFSADDIERFAFDGLTTKGGTVGRAEGHYTVTRRGAGPVTGRLVLLMVRRGGEPRIDLIATEPRPD
jgi:serine/threonine-protein kinase